MRTISITLGAFALTFLAVCELGLAYPVAGWAYLLVAVLFAVALVRPAPLRAQPIPLGALTLIVAIIATLHGVDWFTRKPFLRDLARVQVGMSEAEVRRIMARYVEGTGWPTAPNRAEAQASDAAPRDPGPPRNTSHPPGPGEFQVPNTLVFRHSNEAAFNSDWAIISISDGKVTGVQFSPD